MPSPMPLDDNDSGSTCATRPYARPIQIQPTYLQPPTLATALGALLRPFIPIYTCIRSSILLYTHSQDMKCAYICTTYSYDVQSLCAAIMHTWRKGGGGCWFVFSFCSASRTSQSTAEHREATNTECKACAFVGRIVVEVLSVCHHMSRNDAFT